jgi:hypothetical protein
MPLLEDVVRPFQLPNNAPSQLYQPQTGQTSQQPVLITAGIGSGVGSIRSFTSTYHSEITFYMDQAAVEQETGSTDLAGG